MTENNYLISGVTKTEYEDLINRIDGKETFLEKYIKWANDFKIGRVEVDFKYNPDKFLIGIFVNRTLIIGSDDRVIIGGKHLNLGFVGALKMNLEQILGDVRLKRDEWV